MKRIYFTRHGKSSWENTALKDHDRPLKKRGRKDALLVAEKMLDVTHKPEMIYSSTAQRAKETALIFKETLSISFIQYFVDLYHAGDIQILDFITRIENNYDTLQFFGHNPGYTELANRYLNRSIFNLPTSGTFLVEFNCDSWNDIVKCEGSVKGIWLPRDFK